MEYPRRRGSILSHTGEKVIIDGDGQRELVEMIPVRVAPEEWHDYRVLVRGIM